MCFDKDYSVIPTVPALASQPRVKLTNIWGEGWKDQHWYQIGPVQENECLVEQLELHPCSLKSQAIIYPLPTLSTQDNGLELIAILGQFLG